VSIDEVLQLHWHIAQLQIAAPAQFTTLAQARQKRTRARETLEAGLDPLEIKRAGKVAQKVDSAKGMTFSQCAAEYIKGHQAGWKGEKHVKLWKGSLARFVEPLIGDLPIATIDTGLVLKVLRPTWEIKTKTAVDVRSRIELILSWAKIHGYRHGDNPARWRGHLDNALPKPSKVAKVTHLAAMPYDEVPGFMGKLRANEAVEARVEQGLKPGAEIDQFGVAALRGHSRWLWQRQARAKGGAGGGHGSSLDEEAASR
jgi:hypothetical protein